MIWDQAIHLTKADFMRLMVFERNTAYGYLSGGHVLNSCDFGKVRALKIGNRKKIM